MKHMLTAIYFICISLLSNAQEEIETEESRYKGINIGTETRILDSKINNKHYKLYIDLPASYTKKQDKAYPVLYILDGQWDFANIVTAQNNIRYDRFSPELIIVGISYAGKNPDYGELRTNDMTPTVVPQIKNSGNAQQFTKVLRDEIIPFIDEEYRTVPKNRTLAGTSFAGLYTHYALFNTRDLFHNYIICNPSYWYDNQLAFVLEENYSKNNTTLDANVFLVCGSLDFNLELHHQMVKKITSRGYKGLNFKSSIAEGFEHSGTKSEGYAKGILHSYQIRGIKVAEEKLKKYIGKYQLVPGQVFSLILHEGHLAVKEFNGQTNIPIYAITEDTFSLQGAYSTFEFNKNDKGEVVSLTTESNPDHLVTLTKIK